MKGIIKSELFLKVAIITGFAALLIIFLSSKNENTQNVSKSTSVENQLVLMISLLCNDEEEPKVMIKTDKDGFTVLGVGIVTESANNPVIKEKILELTSKILDVSPARICITI